MSQTDSRKSMVKNQFSRVAAEVHTNITSLLSKGGLRSQTAATDKDAEWQRVHSYIADVLKDAHVLYAKLARLEGDFEGEESANLERISEAVLTIGEELSAFSKAFYEGKYNMQDGGGVYGGNEGGGGMNGGGGGDALPPTPEFPQPAGEDDSEPEGGEDEGDEGDEDKEEDFEVTEETEEKSEE